MDEWVKQMWYVQTNGELLIHKNNKMISFAEKLTYFLNPEHLSTWSSNRT
jgi:hypothetical protein